MDNISNNNNINVDNQKEKEDKLQYKQLVLIILLTVIMVLTSLGLSFSVVSLMENSKNMNFNTIVVPVVPNTDDPSEKFSFTYEEKDFIGNGILIEKMFPTPDDEGMNFKGDNYTFEFNLNFGEKSFDHYYEITAEMLPICTLDSKYVKIYLEANDEPVENVFRSDRTVKVFSDYENATIDSTNDHEKILFSGKVKGTDVTAMSKKFVLKMWISEDMPLTDETMGRVFGVRINVYAK